MSIETAPSRVKVLVRPLSVKASPNSGSRAAVQTMASQESSALAHRSFARSNEPARSTGHHTCRLIMNAPYVCLVLRLPQLPGDGDAGGRQPERPRYTYPFLYLPGSIIAARHDRGGDRTGPTLCPDCCPWVIVVAEAGAVRFVSPQR